ncbi:MAG: hypothetical protein M1823_002668 [Watsoniomyces obsoletus]|nr:MAG: hypothetical protein M1823_002668 [Watsoniomyces obsoletus]
MEMTEAKIKASDTTAQVKGVRKNGKQWHPTKTAFRLKAGLQSWEQRVESRKALKAVKDREKELKDDKEAERQIKERKAAKEEKERYEKMAEKMHRRRVERLKRKEKRNKLLNA